MMEENTAMAVMTIAICDEIRKDAQRLYRQLSTLVPDAELLLYRTRESLLKGLAEGHKICDLIFWDWMVIRAGVWKLYGQCA